MMKRVLACDMGHTTLGNNHDLEHGVNWSKLEIN